MLQQTSKECTIREVEPQKAVINLTWNSESNFSTSIVMNWNRNIESPKIMYANNPFCM